MTSWSIATFAAIFALACGSPGPTLAALVARVVARGRRGILPFCLGLVVGDLVWLTCAVFGLAAIATTFHAAFVVIRWAGAAYLIFLAWKLWTAPVALPAAAAPPKGEGIGLLLGGLAVALGNPKAMLFYLALLPTVVDLGRVGWLGYGELGLVVLVVYPVVLAVYVGLADRMRLLIRSPRAVRVVNRVTGGVMAGAGVAVAARG